MKLTQRTRLMLGCLADVHRSRQLVATAWRGVRRVSYWPASVLAVRLRRALATLARAEETLALAVSCCVGLSANEEVRA